MQAVDTTVSDGLHELFAICATAVCPLDVQGAKTSARIDCLRSEFEELAAVIICRERKLEKFEGFEVVCLEDELPQRPLLQLVLVPEILDNEVLEALFFVDCAAKLVNHRVKYLG